MDKSIEDLKENCPDEVEKLEEAINKFVSEHDLKF